MGSKNRPSAGQRHRLGNGPHRDTFRPRKRRGSHRYDYRHQYRGGSRRLLRPGQAYRSYKRADSGPRLERNSAPVRPLPTSERSHQSWKIKDLLASFIGSDIKFGTLKISSAYIATDVTTGEEVVLNRGPVSEVARGSISFPAVFAVAKRESSYLVEGGLMDPVPVNVVKEMGDGFYHYGKRNTLCD